MNNYLVITDIHGSFKYLEMAMKKFDQYNCKKIFILGDILYHGPRNDLPEEYAPKKCIALLNEYKDKILAVRGNCEAEVDQMVLDFHILEEAQIQVGKTKLGLTHGHHLDEFEYEGYCLYGHTHVNQVDETRINIGSTSIPKDGYHTYAILTEEKITAYNLLTDEVIMEVTF